MAALSTPPPTPPCPPAPQMLPFSPVSLSLSPSGGPASLPSVQGGSLAGLCLVSAKLVENYKHTQGHSGAEPASHRAHLIPPETQQLPPSARGCRFFFFHYLYEQIGLRRLCGGLIVTRDERLLRETEGDRRPCAIYSLFIYFIA